MAPLFSIFGKMKAGSEAGSEATVSVACVFSRLFCLCCNSQLLRDRTTVSCGLDSWFGEVPSHGSTIKILGTTLFLIMVLSKLFAPLATHVFSGVGIRSLWEVLQSVVSGIPVCILRPAIGGSGSRDRVKMLESSPKRRPNIGGLPSGNLT